MRETVVRTPVSGSIRSTPPLPLAKAVASVTRRLPSASTAMPVGRTRSGPPLGVALSETTVRAPVKRLTRTTCGFAP